MIEFKVLIVYHICYYVVLKIKMAFNPLVIILKENKLIGPNYID